MLCLKGAWMRHRRYVSYLTGISKTDKIALGLPALFTFCAICIGHYHRSEDCCQRALFFRFSRYHCSDIPTCYLFIKSGESLV